MNEHEKKERKETDAIRAQALRLGIDIPRTPGWWFEDVDNFGGSLQEWEFLKDDYIYLTEPGKAGARRLIRDEQRKLKDEARQDTQWKMTKAGMIIGWILGAAGILIGLVALFRK